ncbi:MAG: DNA replication and repair protein RecF [Gaiellaceae bacterium]
MVPDHAHPPRGLIVREASLREFRSYERLELVLEGGLVLVTGRNGAGKTNLLEALHVGTQGFSPRARSDAKLVRLGAAAGRIRLRGEHDASPFETEVTLHVNETRRARVNGETLPSTERLRHTFRTLVFTPDRLAVVKGGPAVRRAYLDRSVGRLFPARAAVPAEYAAAVGQRNAALRRVSTGISDTAALEPWTAAVVTHGHDLVESRRATTEALAPAFTLCAAQLGLEAATLGYDGDAPSAPDLEKRLRADLERGVTGLGPHLHDVALSADGRDLRSFGSQGEQRTAVLALVLAEAQALVERTGAAPLVLLDDVLSELDATRRRALGELLSGDSQVILTATSADLLPLEPAQSLVVSPGAVRPA